MAQRTRTQYKSLYGTAGTLFPDNTTGAISEADVRAFGEDGADSNFNLLDDAYTGAKGQRAGATAPASLKDIVTVGMSLTTLVTIVDTTASNVVRIYELVNETTAESSPTVIRPNDYAGTTNEKVWRLRATVDVDSDTGIEHFKGVYADETALTTAHPAAEEGDYAFVDTGAASPVELWIWDESDTEWVQSGATGGTVLSVSGTTDRVTSTGGTTPVIDISATFEALLEKVANKGASGGYVGMSGFSIAFKNLANTFTSLFQNAATAVRTYTFPDRSGTIADDTTIAPYVITEVSAVTTGGTITLNFQVSGIDRQNVIFAGSASFTGAKIFALSNTTVAKNFFFAFEVTSFAGVAVTVPADWSLSTPDFTTGTTWTPTANGRYRMSGVFVNSLWEVFVDGPASV